MSHSFDLSDYRQQLDRLEWIKIRRAELDEMEHEIRSLIEELLPPVHNDRENVKIVGTLDGNVVIEWRPTKSKRLNHKRLRDNFDGVYNFCTDVSYGRSMHIIENKAT